MGGGEGEVEGEGETGLTNLQTRKLTRSESRSSFIVAGVAATRG